MTDIIKENILVYGLKWMMRIHILISWIIWTMSL